MARKKLRLNGFDIFLFAVSNKEAQSYKDLHTMYVQSEEFLKLCTNQGLDGDNILSFTTLYRAIKEVTVSEEDKKNVTKILEAEGYKVSREKSVVATEILRDLFEYRRAMCGHEESSVKPTDVVDDVVTQIDEDVGDSENESSTAEQDSFESQTESDSSKHSWVIPDSEIRKMFESFNGEVQELMQEMAQSPLELQRLTNEYWKARKNFSSMKESRQRGYVMKLIANTYVVSIQELATLLDMEEKEIKEKFLNKKPLRKKASVQFTLHRKIRDKGNNPMLKADSDESAAPELIEPDMIQEEQEVTETETVQENPETIEALIVEEKPVEAETKATHDEPETAETKATLEEPEATKSETYVEERIIEEEQVVSEVAAEEEVAKDQVDEAYLDTPEPEKVEMPDNTPKPEKKVLSEDKIENLNSYRLRDGIYEWFSDISSAIHQSEILVDTNILMNPSLLYMIKSRFVKAWVSDIVLFELKKHLNETKRECSIKVFHDIAKCVRNGYFYVPVMDHDFVRKSDHDVDLIDTASAMKLTFVTADSGAKVYAWTIGCPCRYYRTNKPKAIIPGIIKGKTCVIDVGTKESDLLQYLHAHFSNVIITNEFAKKLNRRKFELEYSVPVTDLQLDIATDTTMFYLPYKMEKSYDVKSEYEMELIELCKQENATLISSDMYTIVKAWSYGVDTYFYE